MSIFKYCPDGKRHLRFTKLCYCSLYSKVEREYNEYEDGSRCPFCKKWEQAYRIWKYHIWSFVEEKYVDNLSELRYCCKKLEKKLNAMNIPEGLSSREFCTWMWERRKTDKPGKTFLDYLRVYIDEDVESGEA